jgi:hypothetical protein
MIDERRQAQATEYALDSLPPEELPEFEQTLLSNPELQLLVRELRACAERLPFALPVVPPPPDLKERIFAGIGGETATAAPVRERSKIPVWVPWAIAACLAVLCVVLIGFTSPEHHPAEFKQKLEDMRLAAICIALIALGSASRRDSAQLNRKFEEVRQAYTKLQREHETLQGRYLTTGRTQNARQT